MKLRSKPLRPRSEKQAAKEKALSRIRPELLRRDSYRCCLCQSRDDAIHAHHVFGRAMGDRWFADPDMLVCLCAPCHRRVTDAADAESLHMAAACRQMAVSRLVARYERVSGKKGAAGIVAGWDTTRAAVWLTEALEALEAE